MDTANDAYILSALLAGTILGLLGGAIGIIVKAAARRRIARSLALAAGVIAGAFASTGLTSLTQGTHDRTIMTAAAGVAGAATPAIASMRMLRDRGKA